MNIAAKKASVDQSIFLIIFQRKGLPIRKIEEIRDEVYQIVGGPPQKPVLDKDKVVAIVNWVDGTVLDSVFKVVG